jgi:hypothetical protein
MLHCHAVPIKFVAHANALTVAVFHYQIITFANYHIYRMLSILLVS